MPLRASIHAVLDGTDTRYGRAYGLFTNAVIVLAVITYAASTMPDLTPQVRQMLAWIETAVIAVFAADYMARLTTSPRPLGYAFSFWGVVDLVAFLPALLVAGADLSSARMLRLIQLARLLKLMRLAQALDHIAGALTDIREQLLVFLVLTMIVLFLAAVGIYQFEHAAQPDVFASVPHALWWAVATLSTVGYGDIYPITPGGRIFTGLVLLIGLAVIAVPTGLISAALVSKSREDKAKADGEAAGRADAVPTPENDESHKETTNAEDP